MKKYELTDDTVRVLGKKLHRIKALRDFGNVTAGDLGGYIETESNLLHDGNAWVSGNAVVSGEARVSGNAQIRYDRDFAVVCGFGCACRTTTFFRCADGLVRTVCGCFYGTLDEFRKEVKKTHGDSKFAKEYLAIADLMEMHFKEEQK